eukprot:7391422-Prymnesium_polylepis.1
MILSGPCPSLPSASCARKYRSARKKTSRIESVSAWSLACTVPGGGAGPEPLTAKTLTRLGCASGPTSEWTAGRLLRPTCSSRSFPHPGTRQSCSSRNVGARPLGRRRELVVEQQRGRQLDRASARALAGSAHSRGASVHRQARGLVNVVKCRREEQRRRARAAQGTDRSHGIDAASSEMRKGQQLVGRSADAVPGNRSPPAGRGCHAPTAVSRSCGHAGSSGMSHARPLGSSHSRTRPRRSFCLWPTSGQSQSRSTAKHPASPRTSR